MEDSLCPAGPARPPNRLPRPPRHRRAISVAAILLLLAATAAAWFWLGHPTGPTAGAPPPEPAPGDRRQAGGEGHHRVGRLHRPLRGDRPGRRRARGSPAISTRSISRTAPSSRRAICCSPSIRALTRRPLDEASRRASTCQDRASTLRSQRPRARRVPAHRRQHRRAVLDQRRQQFLSAQAELDGAKAALRAGASSISNSPRSRAPISGRIGRRLVSVGNLVNANDTLLTTIVSLDPIYFYFDVDERSYLAYARDGDAGRRGLDRARQANEVAWSLTDEPKAEPRQGSIDFVDNRLDSATGTMRGARSFDNTDLFLHARLFGRVRCRARALQGRARARRGDRQRPGPAHRLCRRRRQQGLDQAPIRPGPRSTATA